MIPIIGWLIAAYAVSRLFTVPLSVPRRPDGSLDPIPFLVAVVASWLGIAAVLAMSVWLYLVARDAARVGFGGLL